METASSRPVAPAAHTHWLTRLNAGDWLFAIAIIFGAGAAYSRYGQMMDTYEDAILFLHVPILIGLGWAWRPFRLFAAAVAALSLTSIWFYQGDLARAEQVFFLKYLISSQTAVSWMSVFFFTATGAYWIGLASRSDSAGRIGCAMTWIAAVMGTTGLFVRWYESYLLGPDIGHIPVSNLYEVFVFFSLITALLYLFYEGRYNTRKLGAFVLPVISAAVIFLLWYSFTRDAYQIQPLVPALQSYWMKIHVPANFIGYGGFAIAAMIGIAYLLVSRGRLASRLPELHVLEDVMYKAIAIGFAFFTIATILGALWAAEAWGSYWQWDPKETWALIVWINYAAWLHMRLTRNLRGAMLAWWAVVGLFVTTFAFVGVNMFLSGLHSYGSL
ncbi:MAG: c-type cytochrome biogenesis protein CcsB [Azoarcus sp.]|jgi:cytochrome c-type biogenesis protein CcsB|nr:c-type cytochrome biogenesis protein CcsB [Azoarcus sp.]